MHILHTGLERDFYLKVAFPILTSYLNKHSNYFMPLDGQRRNSFASKEEKVKILQ